MAKHQKDSPEVWRVLSRLLEECNNQEEVCLILDKALTAEMITVREGVRQAKNFGFKWG